MKDFLIIGCGRFGRSIADALTKMGKDVAVMDTDGRIIDRMSDVITYAVQGDATDPTTLVSIGVRSYDAVIVAIGTNLESSIMVTVNLKSLGAKYVIVKAQSDSHAKVLERIGADRIVFPERDMGMRTAYNLTSTNLLDYIELSPEYNIIEIVALPEWENRTLLDLNFSSRYQANIMAIKSSTSIQLRLSGDYVIKRNDVLVIIGHKKSLTNLQK